MTDNEGCGLFILIVILIVCVFFGGSNRAHNQYAECRRARHSVASDSLLVAVRPECQRWIPLVPDSVSVPRG